MRRLLGIGALVATLSLVAACGADEADPSAGSTTTTTTSQTPPVSPEALDVGKYPTAPRPALGKAGNAGAGSLLQAQQLANYVVGPWAVDETLIEPYLETYMLLDGGPALAGLGPQAMADAAIEHGFVNGFASARQASDQVAMVNAVLRFSDPAAATQAAAAMDAVAVGTPVLGATPVRAELPGHPATAASSYPFTKRGTDQQWAAVRAFTPHGSFVLMQFVQSARGRDAATEVTAKMVDAQGPVLDEFKPADAAAFADVPLDPTGLLARTLPLTTPGAAAAKNAVYDPRGAAHFQTNPIASEKLFDDAGVTAIAMAQTNVYEAKDQVSARLIIDSFDRELSGTEGATVAAPVRNLPDSHCVAFPKAFYCVAPADRYAIEARGEQFADVQQQVAAQYVMLTAK